MAAAPSSRATAHALLRANRVAGRLTSVRRGLWAAHELGEDHAVDAFAIAGMTTEDAIVGLHAAMELHGFGYSMRSVVTYFAARPPTAYEHAGTRFRGVRHPIRLVEQDLVDLETTQVDRAGTQVCVTTIERSLVDMLDRQELSGGIEEIWRTTQQLGWLDDRRILRYVQARRSAVLAARVGYLLEQLPELQFPADALAALRAITTTLSPGPFDFAPHEHGELHYVHEWRLRVPHSVIDRTWEEPLA